MVKRIALTARYPFAGCTRIAKTLASEYGYRHISMSDILIQEFTLNLQELSYGTINKSPDEIKMNKELYRKQLHDFAIEYEDQFIDLILEEINSYPGENIVVEKVRSDKQADALRGEGFQLYRIERPEHAVMSVAKRHGHSQETWNSMLRSGSEGRISDDKISDTLTNYYTSDILVKYLASYTRGYL